MVAIESQRLLNYDNWIAIIELWAGFENRLLKFINKNSIRRELFSIVLTVGREEGRATNCKMKLNLIEFQLKASCWSLKVHQNLTWTLTVSNWLWSFGWLWSSESELATAKQNSVISGTVTNFRNFGMRYCLIAFSAGLATEFGQCLLRPVSSRPRLIKTFRLQDRCFKSNPLMLSRQISMIETQSRSSLI